MDSKVCTLVALLVTLNFVGCQAKTFEEWQQEIQGLKGDVQKIIDHVKGAGKGEAWNRLAYLTDVYGPRLIGTKALEDAIDYLEGEFKTEFGEENVHDEEVTGVPNWKRDQNEYVELYVEGDGIGPHQRTHTMYVMSIGLSVPTPAEGLPGTVLVLNEFDEVQEKCAEVDGKIVVFNQEWTTYGDVFMYRSWAASEVESCGGIAVLSKSLTQFSIYSPHTGTQTRNSSIPALCITIEDAEMIQRLSDRGKTVEVKIFTQNDVSTDDSTSRNLISDIKGTETLNEYVVIGGHIDSWDVGTGAMDDGGGVILCWMAQSVIKATGLTLRRTLRSVLWTDEENNGGGADKFYDTHKDESISILMESDAGAFAPTGLGFQGSGLSEAIMEEITKLLEDEGDYPITDDMTGSVDLEPWKETDNQLSVLNTDEEGNYWKFHHTEADTMTMMDPDDMDNCLILWATTAYVLSKVEELLPKTGDYPTAAAGARIQNALPQNALPVIEESYKGSVHVPEARYRAERQSQLDSYWKDQIHAMKGDMEKIIQHVNSGGAETAWERLAYLTDVYGPRISGSRALEDAIDYLNGVMKTEFGDGNVKKEEVNVPNWVRGTGEYAEVTLSADAGKPLHKRVHRMYIQSIGLSKPTPPAGLEAPIIVLKSFDELEEKCSEAANKIVVFNQPWTTYSDVFMYRSWGASEVEKCNGRAVLVRSLTQFSLYSPHTGGQSRDADIPAATITVEDAELLQRFHDKGQPLEVKMVTVVTSDQRSTSYNLVADVEGTERPDEFVVFGGHIDSWDVGTGAMDDAGGVMVSWMALSIIKELNLTPKRTMRSIFWTAEEVGADGAQQFYEDHKYEDVSLIMESDAGTFLPTGIGYEGSDTSRLIMEEIMLVLKEAGFDEMKVTNDMSGSVDLGPWMDDQNQHYQAAVLNNDEAGDYWMFHHTEGDTMTVETQTNLGKCTILWTATAYAVANLNDMLPRHTSGVAQIRALGGTQLFVALLVMVVMKVWWKK